jgi:antitoxin HicB
MKYSYVIERAPANVAGFFPDLPGVATAASTEELKEKMSQMLAMVLYDYAETGQSVPNPTSPEKLDLSEYEIELADVEVDEVEPATLNPVSLELQDAIRARGLSRAEVARRMGVTRSVVSRLTNPFYFGHSLSSLRRIAKVLDADLEIEFKLKAA